MLYFDNAATTYPKPFEVRKAVNSSFVYYGANPGRSGHSLAMDTAREVFKCREKAAKLFGCGFPANVIFTKNCTEAINLVIMSIVPGGHCVISDLEHNSVLRPLYDLKTRGEADFSVAKVAEGDTDSTLMSFKNAIKKNTKLIAVTLDVPIAVLLDLPQEHACQCCGTQTVVLTGSMTTLDQVKPNFENFEKLYGIHYIIPEKATFATAIGAGLCSLKRKAAEE